MSPKARDKTPRDGILKVPVFCVAVTVVPCSKILFSLAAFCETPGWPHIRSTFASETEIGPNGYASGGNAVHKSQRERCAVFMPIKLREPLDPVPGES